MAGAKLGAVDVGVADIGGGGELPAEVIVVEADGLEIGGGGDFGHGGEEILDVLAEDAGGERAA